MKMPSEVSKAWHSLSVALTQKHNQQYVPYAEDAEDARPAMICLVPKVSHADSERNQFRQNCFQICVITLTRYYLLVII